MKILYVTTVGSTMAFFQDLIKELLNEGHAVDIATNESIRKTPECYTQWGCRVFPISCSRSPLANGNLIAIDQIRKLVENEKYDIVHCHTPVAAMCTRLACRNSHKSGTKVFYTAHGFHFYKGAPLKNWLLYYPVEKLCAHFTDVLITINQEDYALARKKMKARRVEYVPGVGIDLQKFGQTAKDRATKRMELGIPENATLLLSVGELNKNKNHEAVIRAIAAMDVYYMIAGQGDLQEHLQRVIDDLKISDKVKLLGYRSDVGELCAAADAFVLPSYREGLPVAVMEAMASGLPVACSQIRGNTDLIDENGGVLFDPHSVGECKKAIEALKDMDLEKIGAYNRERIREFEVGNVNEIMSTLYGC